MPLTYEVVAVDEGGFVDVHRLEVDVQKGTYELHVALPHLHGSAVAAVEPSVVEHVPLTLDDAHPADSWSTETRKRVEQLWMGNGWAFHTEEFEYDEIAASRTEEVVRLERYGPAYVEVRESDYRGRIVSTRWVRREEDQKREVSHRGAGLQRGRPLHRGHR